MREEGGREGGRKGGMDEGERLDSDLKERKEGPMIGM